MACELLDELQKAVVEVADACDRATVEQVLVGMETIRDDRVPRRRERELTFSAAARHWAGGRRRSVSILVALALPGSSSRTFS
jgi:hypothetical protein